MQNFALNNKNNKVNYISAICLRKNGYLWAGITDGVLVHNGFYLYETNFENSDLLDKTITSIAKDEHENL